MDGSSHQSDPLRRARLRWRARRGLLENDLIFERFFSRYEHDLSDADVGVLTSLLELSDNDLMDLLLEGTKPAGKVGDDPASFGCSRYCAPLKCHASNDSLSAMLTGREPQRCHPVAETRRRIDVKMQPRPPSFFCYRGLHAMAGVPCLVRLTQFAWPRHRQSHAYRNPTQNPRGAPSPRNCSLVTASGANVWFGPLKKFWPRIAKLA